MGRIRGVEGKRGTLLVTVTLNTCRVSGMAYLLSGSGNRGDPGAIC